MWAYRGLFLSCRDLHKEASSEVIKNAQRDFKAYAAEQPEIDNDKVVMCVPQQLCDLSKAQVLVTSPVYVDSSVATLALKLLFDLHQRMITVRFRRSTLSLRELRPTTQWRISVEYADNSGGSYHKILVHDRGRGYNNLNICEQRNLTEALEEAVQDSEWEILYRQGNRWTVARRYGTSRW